MHAQSLFMKARQHNRKAKEHNATPLKVKKSTLRYLYVTSLPTEAAQMAGLNHTYATLQSTSTNKQVNSNMNVHVHVDARI